MIFFTAFINLFIGSASAKWTLLGPVLVPMFMLVGYSPEFVQAAYRVGDSCTNIITPLMVYFPLVLTFAQKYAPKTCRRPHNELADSGAYRHPDCGA